MPLEPYIPRTITVHLGRPSDTGAENVTVPFPDYIKNVASSEIYPTWPDSALRANIYAQISFALNRYYTEWYRSRGYDFDITNSTQYDQAFVRGRDIFGNISDIVDDIFNSYVRRQGTIEPYFTEYCNGTTVTCPGLSQWGTVELANQGYTPYEILQSYYGDDIDIVQNAPVRTGTPSYPGYALQEGDAGNDVQRIQAQLNRISRNYPAIPKIYPVDGVFGKETTDAVREFQRIFGLTVDDVVGNATWYRIAFLYTSVKKLAELRSEGIALSDLPQQYEQVLREGDTGNNVRIIQYYLSVIAAFYDTVPDVAITGVFDEATKNAVIAFQNVFGLTPDGIVGRNTWRDINRTYRGIVESAGPQPTGVVLYPGTVLRLGSQGEDVEILQTYLSLIADTYTDIPKVPVTGVFGNQTQAAVVAFQQFFGLERQDGVVGPITWDRIASVYEDLTSGYDKQNGQYPGYELGEEANASSDQSATE